MSRRLYSYWDNARAGRTAPERGDIDPSAIRDILAYTFILEVAAGSSAAQRDVTFRLSGTRLNALFQRDLKGSPFSDIWQRDAGALAGTVLDGVLDDRAAMVAGVMGSPFGYDRVDFEMTLLPLRHYGRTHSRALGSIAALVMPSWIGLSPVDGLEFRSFRHIAPSRNNTDAAVSETARPLPATTRTRDVPTAVSISPGVMQVGAFTVYQGGQTRPSTRD